MPKPIPVPDELSKPFWAAANEGRLVIHHCKDCDTLQHPPRPRCRDCGSENLEWKEVSGKGRLSTCMVVDDGRIGRMQPDQPFNLATITLDEDPRVIDIMAGRGIFFVPTLTVYEYHRKSALKHVRERALDLQEHHIQSIRRALAAGVKIVAGTDAGLHGHPRNALELQHLVAAGLTPLQAIQAATGWAAECLGLEDQLGTVQKGKLADLVVVAGDPLADINVLQDPDRIDLVMKGGEFYNKSLPLPVSLQLLTPRVSGISNS